MIPKTTKNGYKAERLALKKLAEDSRNRIGVVDVLSGNEGLSSNYEPENSLIMRIEKNGLLFPQAFFDCPPAIRLFDMNRYLSD